MGLAKVGLVHSPLIHYCLREGDWLETLLLQGWDGLDTLPIQGVESAGYNSFVLYFDQGFSHIVKNRYKNSR